MTCPNGVSYSIICTEDAPAVSKCAFRWNGVTTNVTAKMTASEPYACEATLDAAIIPLLPK